jgi:hypothetical protein
MYFNRQLERNKNMEDRKLRRITQRKKKGRGGGGGMSTTHSITAQNTCAAQIYVWWLGA